ncbi:Putative teichuronic acid biosynthesis glycosyltransferase TuaC [Planctomycetes bacterium Poly30]|uniref:Teichuronic acid biosynthesis glycosyltransferase TuaC n=1 Tax=Saltatorellus ferox TaxID=2528018 RepID=A0A518ERJ6_9BACT|nr:Putative teichuronic acid biosynthesis glycosyltransferase TuaC [Planctomycetes bacterium Poly30]
MRVRVLTSLYPSPETPFEGIFAARKWEGLARRGHEVDVVVPLPWAPRALQRWLPEHHARMARTPRVESRSGLEIVRPRYLHVPSRSVGNAARFALVGVEQVLRSEAPRPDVCVIDYAWPGAAAAPALAAAGVPVVINGRGSDVLQVAEIASLRAELSRGLRAAKAITAVSQDLLDAMIDLGGSADAATLTPNGVDTDHFAPGSRDDARRRVGQPPGDRMVLVVGHLIPRKDPILSLEAFRAAGVPDARLVFVGRGPLMEDVRAHAGAIGLGDRVILLGERPPAELVDWYRAADAMLLTSSREGRPNVVLEALSTGCPVVATDAGGTGEVVTSERMLARTREAAVIGAMLADILQSPPTADELRASIEHLTWRSSLDALERILKAASSGSTSESP